MYLRALLTSWAFCFISIYKYPEPYNQRQLPTKWGDADEFILKPVCLLVDIWALITVWLENETHIVISRDL